MTTEKNALRNRVIAGLAALGVTVGGVAIAKFMKKNAEKENKGKGQTELLSETAQARKLTVFVNRGKSSADFLTKNGYSFELPIGYHQGYGIFGDALDVDVLKDDKCVALAAVSLDGDGNVRHLVGLEVLSDSADLMALMESQAGWKKLGEKSISLRENESLAEKRKESRKNAKEFPKEGISAEFPKAGIPAHRIGKNSRD